MGVVGMDIWLCGLSMADCGENREMAKISVARGKKKLYIWGMGVTETGCHSWTCPDCNCKNEMFLIKGDELPEVLECSFCNHISPEIKWEKI